LSDDHSQHTSTHSARAQLRASVENRKRRLLQEARERMERRAKAEAKAREAKTVLRFTLPSDVYERARKVCLAVEGVELAAFVRQTIVAFADELPAGRRKQALDAQAENDSEWADMILEYLDSLEEPAESGYIEISCGEILDMLEIPAGGRNRVALMSVGRIMKRLRWGRVRVRRADRWEVVYRKPGGF
jgi:hypothetical protein